MIGWLVLPALECWVLNKGMRKEGESPGRVLKGQELEREERREELSERDPSVPNPVMLNDNAL